MNLSIIDVCFCLLMMAVVIFCIRIGFTMGRMTQDKPTGDPKQFDPGSAAALAEYDPYEDAASSPNGKSTVEDK